MDSRTLEALEFDKIIDMLKDLAASSVGAQACEHLRPLTDSDQIERRLEETDEARGLLDLGEGPPLGGISDIRQLLARSSRGGALSAPELLAVADVLRAARLMRRYLERHAARAPSLARYAIDLTDLAEVEGELRRCITGAGEVADSASQKLASLRKRIAVGESRVREHLEFVIRSPAFRQYLQDPIITIRSGRYVVPVKSECRDRVPGVVHDRSASGATLFIEPMAAVELNNHLRELRLAEKAEVERILVALSALVGGRAEEVGGVLDVLAALDCIFARGHLSAAMDAVRPRLNEEGIIHLRGARHPLLRGHVVPIDVSLGEDFDTLVITGPNTGGKTVTLKTVGLLSLMAQAGLHIPALPGSETAVFRSVFCDIGDEQSIEQNLSTFSSHMNNIVRIVEEADNGSLVLLDEIGAGTDPLEGSALAMALLDHFLAVGAKTIATTHYSRLKAYAFSRQRVENASVEFDVETLRPTFRLVIGLPGRSNAFEISLRLGLSRETVNRARAFLSIDEHRVESLIEDMTEKTRALEEARVAAERERQEAARLKEETKSRRVELARKEEKILEQAKREAAAIVRRAKREAEEIIARLRQVEERVNSPDLSREIQRAGEDFGKLRREIGGLRADAADDNYDPVEGLEVGMTVLVRDLRREGVVEEVYEDGQVAVRVGVMRMTLSRDELAVAHSTSARQPRPSTSTELLKDKRKGISPEVHLRGMTVEEALAALTKHLDDAVLAGLDRVRVVHGKGTGILRKAVHEYLETQPLVRSFNLAPQREGGAGVTIVELR